MELPTSARMELVLLSLSKAVFSRVSPPYWPLKQPHGTNRPRVSHVKKKVSSAGAGGDFFCDARKTPIPAALSRINIASQRFMCWSIQQGIRKNVHVHL